MCETYSEPTNLEVENSLEDHQNLTQELVAPSNEPTQCEDKVELLNFSPDVLTNSFITVVLIDFLGVDKFNWVVDPYFVQLINNFKTNLVENVLVVEHQYSQCLKQENFQLFDHLKWFEYNFLSKGFKLVSFVHHYQPDGGVFNN